MDDLLDPEELRRRLARGGVVEVFGGRGSGRSTTLRRLAGGLPSGWDRAVLDGRTHGGHEFDGQARLYVVDDPERLAPRVLERLVARAVDGAAVLVASTDEAPVPEGVSRLRVVATRVHVPPLTAADVASMLRDLLGVAPDRVDVERVRSLTGGRPGLVRRLGVGPEVDRVGNVALLPADLAGLTGSIGWRRERVTTAARHTLLRLAVRDGLDRADLLARAVGATEVEAAVAEGHLRPGGGVLEVTDPLLRAVLAGPDRRLHGQEDATRLLGCIEGSVAPDVADEWRVEAGVDLDPGLGAAAIERIAAREGPTFAVRFVGLTDEPVDTGVLDLSRARVIASAGRPSQALPLLQAVAASGGEHARVAVVRMADHRFFREGDLSGALDSLERIGDTEDAVGAEAAAMRMLLRSAAGRLPPEAEAVDQGVGPPPPSVRLVLDLRAILAGRVTGPSQVAVLSDEDSPSRLPLAERSRANMVAAAIHGGGPLLAAPIVEEGVSLAAAAGRPAALGLALALRGWVERLEGDLVGADRTLRAAGLRIGVDDQAGLGRAAPALRATVLAELGRLADAAELLGEGLERPPDDMRTRLFAGGACVRVLAAHDRPEAVARALDDIRSGASTGHAVWAVLVGLDAARVGLAGEVVEATTAAADGTVGLAAAAGAAVTALAGRDRVALVGAAEQLAGLGVRRVAAELLLSVAPADPVLHRRAAALLDGLGPPHPQIAASISVLTPRERQVATLAATGATSSDVADRLGLSVRTVDNHLRSVYRKLGIEGRGSLGAVLGPTRPDE